MRIENRDGEGECYQINHDVKAVYSDKEKRLISLTIKNQPILDDFFYKFSIQNFHFGNSKSYLNITQEELSASGKTKVVSTSIQQILEEFFRNNQKYNQGN